MNSTFHQNEAPFSLSIIIPNFNDAKFLKECIDSIVTQSVTPDELIILDDASTDNSIEVISKAISGYPFARIEHNPVNLGFGGVPNANRGLQLAKSKYVYFLGANDFILPGLIEAIKNGSMMRWSHFNLAGEYDFSDEKMIDSVGLSTPKKPL